MLVPVVAGTVATMTNVFILVTVEVIVVSVEAMGVDARVTVGVIVTVVWKSTIVTHLRIQSTGRKASIRQVPFGCG